MDADILASDDEIDAKIKEKMNIIDAKLKEIRAIRAEIRKLNSQRVKRKPITVHVPVHRKDEIKKKIKEIIDAYR